MKTHIILALAMIVAGLSGCATTGDYGRPAPGYYSGPGYFQRARFHSYGGHGLNRGLRFGRGLGGFRHGHGRHYGGHRR